jgi:hypothetical protein
MRYEVMEEEMINYSKDSLEENGIFSRDPLFLGSRLRVELTKNPKEQLEAMVTNQRIFL